jgi:type VI protein secretion system component Hcp
MSIFSRFGAGSYGHSHGHGSSIVVPQTLAQTIYQNGIHTVGVPPTQEMRPQPFAQYHQSSIQGHPITVPVVDPQIVHQNRIVTPEWMILIDDLMSSSIENFEDYGELYGWYAEQARVTEGSTANNLFSTSTVQHSNVVIVIPNNVYGPTLEFKMASGSKLSKIKIVRLSNMKNLKVAIQVVTFANCRIESIQQQLDRLVVSFRPEKRENKVFKWKQDGKKEGQAVTKFDYTKGTGE